MIATLFAVLQDDKYKDVSEDIKSIKGKYQYPRTFKDAWKKGLEGWQKR